MSLREELRRLGVTLEEIKHMYGRIKKILQEEDKPEEKVPADVPEAALGSEPERPSFEPEGEFKPEVSSEPEEKFSSEVVDTDKGDEVPIDVVSRDDEMGQDIQDILRLVGEITERIVRRINTLRSVGAIDDDSWEEIQDAAQELEGVLGRYNEDREVKDQTDIKDILDAFVDFVEAYIEATVAEE